MSRKFPDIKNLLIPVLLLLVVCSSVHATEILVRGEQQLVLQPLATTKLLVNATLLNNMASNKRLSNTMRWYSKPSGLIVGIGDSFFIQLPDEQVSAEVIDTLLAKYDLTLVKQYLSHVYLVRSDGGDIISLINLIYQDADTLDAYPNYYKKIRAR